MKARRVLAALEHSETLSSDWQRLRFRAPEVAAQAQPGQFLMLGPLESESFDPFLNRPYSIHRRLDEERIELLVARVGRGSTALAGLEPGAQVPLLGPLGRGFRWEAKQRRALLVAGGVGVAPLVFLAESLRAEGLAVSLVMGAATAAALLPVSGLVDLGISVLSCTDDGSAGLQGTAVDAAQAWLDQNKPGSDLLLAACGPEPMLAALSGVCRQRALSAQLSMENRMACGTGVCMGCSRVVGGQALRVCVEGPVFDLEEAGL